MFGAVFTSAFSPLWLRCQNTPEQYFDSALVEFRKGNFAVARTCLDELITNAFGKEAGEVQYKVISKTAFGGDSVLAQAFALRSSVKCRQGEDREALSDINYALQLHSAGKYYYARGLLKYKKGDYKGALKDFEKARQKGYDEYDLYVSLGNTGIALDDYKIAVDNLSKVISMDTSEAEGYRDRARANIFLRDYDENKHADSAGAIVTTRSYKIDERNRQYRWAIEDLSRAIRLKPDEAESYYFRAMAYTSLDSFTVALNDFNAAIHLAPSEADYYNERGVCLLELARYQDALNDFNRAVELDNQCAVCFYNIAITYINIGGKQNQQLAIDNLFMAIKYDSLDKSSYETRAELYFSMKRYAEAADDYSRILFLDKQDEIYPEDHQAYYYRGIARCKMKHFMDGCDDLKKSLSIMMEELGQDELNVSKEIKKYCQ